MLLLSLQTFVLFERKCPAKWTSHDIPPWFQFEYSIHSALKCARREFKLYIFTDVSYMMSHSSVRKDVAQRKSMNECSEVKLTSADFPCWGSREQWTLCREHVNRNTVHSWSALLTSWLSESGVLTKRHEKYVERWGARTGIENRWFRVICLVFGKILIMSNRTSLKQQLLYFRRRYCTPCTTVFLAHLCKTFC